ncbi:MAG: ABC transporter ATP-binding protein [Thermoguttaceae bacterium]|jgi:ABC-2 type transport system ATP-binding protein
MAPAIVTKNLTKWYGKTRALNDLNLEVRRGEVFGFLGPNGAGKTTTIRLLLDLIRPTSGQAAVLGFDCRRQSINVRRRVGYVPGEFSLYEALTGDQFLGFIAGLRGGMDRRKVLDLSERLDCNLRRPIRELSRGNKQKICIIQALMNQPEVLLLDEPTSGLDPLMQQEFFKIIAEVCEEGRTVLFSSHILSEVERACERVAIIREGRILMISSVAELKAKSVRRVEIAFDGVVPDGLFANLSEVRAIVQEDNRLYCIVQGSLDAMIKTLANHKVSDMISQEPSLEDIFLAFYNEDPHAA